MPRPRLTAASRLHRAAAPGRRPCGARARSGFTLTELLVAAAIILGLMTLIGTAVSNVRASQKTMATQDAIRRLDAIVMRQFRTYDSQFVNPALLKPSATNPPPAVFTSPVEKRAWHLRRNVLTGDLPDRWTDVSFMSARRAISKWDATPLQRSYINVWNFATPKPSDTFAGAECLFMIVMQSGVAEPSDLRNLPPIGDKDGDSAMEFLDAWGNPIAFILWPYAVEVPSGSGRRFFSGSRTPASIFVEDADGDGMIDPKLAPAEVDRNGNGVVDYPSATLGMRPLIYSAGPDGEYGLERNSEAGNLGTSLTDAGAACGDWANSPTSTSAAPLSSFANDNLTNLDAEATR